MKKKIFFQAIFILILFNNLFSLTPSTIAEKSQIITINDNTVLKYEIYDLRSNLSKKIKFYQKKLDGKFSYIGSFESIRIEEKQVGEGFQDIYTEDDSLVIQQSFGDGKYLIISKLYFNYEKRGKIKLVQYTEQHIDRFSDDKDFSEIKYDIPDNIYLNNITNDLVLILHRLNVSED